MEFEGKYLLSEKGYNIARETVMATYFALSNGYMGIRGSLEESNMVNAQGTYIRGIIGNHPVGVAPVIANEYMKKWYFDEDAVRNFDKVIANVLPDEKDAVIQKLQAFCNNTKKQGKTNSGVIMVGDGINDAPALTRADVGFAIGAGTDIAIDSADVVLVNSKLSDVSAAIRLSKYVIRNIHENLFWAFIYNIIGIPLAAGFWIPITGWSLTPMFGAAAMSLSSFCVVTNALRLNLFDIYKNNAFLAKHPALNDLDLENHKEENKMTKEIKIKGMMCEMCEKHVRKALEGLDGVSTVTKVSHEEGLAVIETSSDVSEASLKAAIDDAGYEFVSVK